MLFLALGDAKVPDARYFAFWWNIGFSVKPFALGPYIGLDPQCHNCQTCWYLKTLKFALPPTGKHKICVTPNTKPQHETMEYRLCWVPKAKLLQWKCTFHVVCAHFICFGYPTGTQFAVEYGLNRIEINKENYKNSAVLYIERCTCQNISRYNL